MSSDSLDLRGRVFALPPAQKWGINNQGGDRLVAMVLTDGEQRHFDDILVPSFASGAIDLSIVRGGRCPVVLEHRMTFGDMLGAVVDAWQEGATLQCIARLAEGGEADRVWALLTQGFPLSLSGGYLALDVEPGGPSPHGGSRFNVLAWRLTEISVVIAGKDQNACCRPVFDDEVAALVARRAAARSEAPHLALLNQLRLGDWNAWVPEAAAAIADEMGVDRSRLTELLSAEVSRHATRLLDALT